MTSRRLLYSIRKLGGKWGGANWIFRWFSLVDPTMRVVEWKCARASPDKSHTTNERNRKWGVKPGLFSRKGSLVCIVPKYNVWWWFMDLDCLLLVFPIMRQPLHIALPAGKDGTYQIDAAKVLLRRGDPSVRLQLVLCSTKKDCARCGRWDASFRLLATPPPTVHKACKMWFSDLFC